MNIRSFLLLIFCLALPSLSQAEPTVVVAEAFPALSFNRPLAIAQAPDGLDRMFVLEQKGRVLVFPRKKAVTRYEVFLDISAQVSRRGNEEGLLGVAFDPEYKTNGEFYLYYSAAAPRRTVLSRFTAEDPRGQRAQRGSEAILLEIKQPYSNHNGGQLAFGPDGYLYIGVGDGGAGGDPQGHGQNRETLLGSVLRIDVHKRDGNKRYGIPPDNPFVSNPSYRPEIYAYGLRNPWRFSFDSATKELWLADVGQNKLEEIHLIEKGKNYGWDVLEGSACFEPQWFCKKDGLELPVHEYGRSLGQSITGGYVYRGKQIPGLVGYYVYGDFISGRIWALRRKGQEVENVALARKDIGIASFGTDGEGELYITGFDGKIYSVKASSR